MLSYSRKVDILLQLLLLLDPEPSLEQLPHYGLNRNEWANYYPRGFELSFKPSRQALYPRYLLTGFGWKILEQKIRSRGVCYMRIASLTNKQQNTASL